MIAFGKGPSMSDDQIICPICRNANKIKKISGIYHSGKVVGVSVTPIVGVGTSVNPGTISTSVVSGVSTSKSYSQTYLSQMFTPPSEPEVIHRSGGFGATLLVMIGSLVFVFCSYMVISELPLVFKGVHLLPFDVFLIVAPAISGVLGLLIAIRNFRIARLKKNTVENQTLELDRQNHLKWEQRKAIWDRLYYCETHDIVFDPLTKKNFPPKEMHLLLS
jgi:hypothetical protein